MLRWITYLAPSLPLDLFRGVVDYVAHTLQLECTLDADVRTSGPPLDEADPFAAGRYDFGFVCAPAFLRRSTSATPSVDLVPAAFVFDDPRLAGRPVYFSDVIVPHDAACAQIEDLVAARWAYNDEHSLSGYGAPFAALEELGAGEHFRGSAVASGSHLASIAMVASGEVDAAAIDSNVLRAHVRSHPAVAARVRAIAALGPSPIQPIVVRSALPPQLKVDVANALRGMHESRVGRAVCDSFEIARFAEVSRDDYSGVRLEAWRLRTT